MALNIFYGSQPLDNKSYLLNQDAYYDMFPGAVWQKYCKSNKQRFNLEASKATHIVKMNHVNLTKIFMHMVSIFTIANIFFFRLKLII